MHTPLALEEVGCAEEAFQITYSSPCAPWGPATDRGGAAGQASRGGMETMDGAWGENYWHPAAVRTPQRASGPAPGPGGRGVKGDNLGSAGEGMCEKWAG